jgi:secreted PhoX family phosphatase
VTSGTTRWGRRSLLLGAGAALGGAGVSLLGGPLRSWLVERRARWRPGPFGALRPDPDGLLDLPEGFSYRVIDRSGAPLDDGFVAPEMPDAMGCFALPDGSWALMRNHELPLDVPARGPARGRAMPGQAFDARGAGGVSRVVLDPVTLERRSSNLVLAGTVMNCAGGVSPWGWLSCEETVEAGHGFVFLCDPGASGVAAPRRLPSLGRFRHEAAAVDPRTNVIYLTEDREDACLYRLVPHDPSDPFEGELQALRVRGRPRFDTGARLGPNPVEIDWVPVREPAPADDVVRGRAQGEGAARIARGEGLTVRIEGEQVSILVSATIGGRGALGQILELCPEGDGGTLRVLAASDGRHDLEMPDNLTVGPGDRVYVCEDGGGHDYVRGLDPRTGELFDFARNARSIGEISGVCFAPDGTAMFLNLQVDGLTLAIRGPFV